MKNAVYEKFERKQWKTNWETIETCRLEKSYSFDELLNRFEEWYKKLTKSTPFFVIYSISPWPEFLSLADTEMLCFDIQSPPTLNGVEEFYKLSGGFYEKTKDFPLSVEYEQNFSAGMLIMGLFKPSTTLKREGICGEGADRYWWGILSRDFGKEACEISPDFLTVDQLRGFIEDKRMEIKASCLDSNFVLDIPSSRTYCYYQHARLYEDESQIKVIEDGESFLDNKRKAEIQEKLKTIIEDMIQLSASP